jgi:uncharacterized protein YegP (UPF0339 family)
MSVDRTFTVKNVGSGTLTGNASTTAPFTIVSGGSYSLTAGQSQAVTVRFSPPSAGAFSGSVSFTGGGGASIAVSGAALPPATFAASPASVVSGTSVTANWSGVASPTAADWIGLYAPGAPNTSYITWRYTTGTASGSVPVTVPASLAAGNYELRLFTNNGYTRIAVSNSFTVTSGCVNGTLSASPATVSVGNAVTATWGGVCAPTSSDWIGLFAPGAPNTAYLAWRYTTGTVSGSAPVTIPTSVTPGTYELRLFSSNGVTRLAVSNSFTVIVSCSGGALSASPASVATGGSVSATWSGICAPSGGDWIGLFVPGAPNTAYSAWRYTTGAASGTVPLTIPVTLAPGTYELRLFAGNGYTRLAVSNSFTVTTGCTGGTLSASPASVGAGGSVTATWSGLCGPAGSDWIGVFAPGAPNTAYLAWRYTTGTASGSLPVTIPYSLAAGTYELRLFANNGATRLGPSNPFAVTSP